MGQMRFRPSASLLLLAAALCLGCKEGGKAASPATGSYGQGGQATANGPANGPANSPANGQAPGQVRRQPAITVQAIEAVSGPLGVSRNSSGVVTASVQSQVAALVSGVVSRVMRKSGDWVGAGDLVVQLDESQLRIALANAQAALDTARINLQTVQDSTAQNSQKLSLQVQSAQATRDSAKKFYDSQKALFDLGGLSASTLDTAGASLANAEAALETAKIALDQNQRGVATTANQNVEALKIAVTTAHNNIQQAELNLRNTAIRAPFAGQVSAVNVTPGMYVGLNTAVFVLVSAERQVNFSISPQDAPALPLGSALVFSWAGKSYPLTIRQAPSAPVNGVVPMVAGGPGLSGLSYGLVGDLSYQLVLATGILVPMNAIDTTDNRNYVYIVEGGKVALREIRVVAESGAVAAVGGLAPGSLVVVSPPPGLVPGAAVTTIPAQGIDLGTGAKAAASPVGPGSPTGSPGQARGSRPGKTSGSPGAGSGAAPASQGPATVVQPQAARP